MKYKLIALDMDATLLNNDKVITEKTEKALIEAQKRGVKVAIISGRMPFAMQKYINQLQLKKYNGYYGCFNGGLILNSNDEIIHKEYLDKKYLKAACEIAVDTDITVVVHKADGLYGNTNRNKFTDVTFITAGLKLTQVDDLYNYVDWNIHKILFVGEFEKLKQLKEKLTEKYSEELEIVFSSPWFLEAMPKGVSKGTALQTVCEKSGIDISEAIACGDNFNDKAMLEVAGLSVVMANGVEEMKKIADYVTVNDCNNDGIAEVVDKFIFL